MVKLKPRLASEKIPAHIPAHILRERRCSVCNRRFWCTSRQGNTRTPNAGRRRRDIEAVSPSRGSVKQGVPRHVRSLRRVQKRDTASALKPEDMLR